MEEISPTSYCGMLVIGLKYFAVGNFESSASEHSVNQIQFVIHIVTWFFLEISLLGGCFDAASFEEEILTFTAVGFLTLSMAKFAMFSLNRNTLHKFIKLIDIDAVSRTKTDVYIKKAIESIAVTSRSYAFVCIFSGLAYSVSAIFLEKVANQQTEEKYMEIYNFYVPYDVIIFERIGIARLILTMLVIYHGYCQIFLDIVSISLFTHVGGQFEATANMFINVPYLENHAESAVRLKDVIYYHQLILRYAEKLQTMHNRVFLVQLVESCVPLCFSLLLCVQTLKSAEGSNLEAISHMSLFGVMSFQLFLYTRCADLAKDKAPSLNDPASTCKEDDPRLCVFSLESYGFDPEVDRDDVDLNLLYRFSNLPADPQDVFTKEKDKWFNFMNPAGTTLLVGTIGGISGTFTSQPLLTQPCATDEYCSVGRLPERCRGRPFCVCPHVQFVTLGSIVQLVLVSEVAGQISHPVHLHGFFFNVLTSGHLDDEPGLTPEILMKKKFRNGDPVMKDTLLLPFNGYAVIRFKADNPGFWLFHCHIEAHMSIGMMMTFQVGERNEIPPAPPDFPQCGDWPSSCDRPYYIETLKNPQ